VRCPLCDAENIQHFHRDARREYWRCAQCALVFVPRRFHLSPEAERNEYLLHENRVEDPGYRRFLSRLSRPLLARLCPSSSGLDFGCGSGPALAAMLREAGHTVAVYDPFFAPERQVLDDNYDFVTATEVVEHLGRPGMELDRLWGLLQPGGWLGIMTKLVLGQREFAGWHYKNDPTHVCFFSRQTWEWWAGSKGAALEFTGSDVMLLQRVR